MLKRLLNPQEKPNYKRLAAIGLGVVVILILLAAAINTLRGSPGSSATPVAEATQESIYRVVGSARINARASANTNAAVVTTLGPGDEVQVVEQVQGQSVNGSRVWYRALIGDQTVYIHSSLLSETRRARQEGRAIRPAQQAATAPARSTNAPALAQTEPLSPFGCNGQDDLSCSDFRDMYQDANIHLAQCGDEDRLDPDGDGEACELD
jgi:hypothetical protein